MSHEIHDSGTRFYNAVCIEYYFFLYIIIPILLFYVKNCFSIQRLKPSLFFYICTSKNMERSDSGSGHVTIMLLQMQMQKKML